MKPRALVAALAVTGIALGFYSYHLLPTVGFVDAPRYSAKAYSLDLGIRSIDHPLFMVIAYPVARSGLGPNIAWRVNFVSALFGALTVGLLFVLIYLLFSNTFIAAVCALAGMTSWNLWWCSTEAEVYTLNSFFLILVYIFILQYLQTRGLRYLIGAGFVIGLSLVNHQTMVLVLPGLAVLMTIKGIRSSVWNPRVAAAIIGFGVVGLSPYLILVGEHITANSLLETMEEVTGGEFNERMLAFPGWREAAQYFGRFAGIMFANFDWIHFIIGWYGVVLLWRTHALFARFVIATMIVHLLFFMNYQVPDRLFFYLPVYLSFIPFIGAGIERALSVVRGKPARTVVYSLLLLSPILTKPWGYSRSVDTLKQFLDLNRDKLLGLFIPHIPGRNDMRYYVYPGKRGITAGDWYEKILLQVPPQALIVDDWYHGYSILAEYLQGAYRLRPDVQVVRWFDQYGGTDQERDNLEMLIRERARIGDVFITTTEHSISALIDRLTCKGQFQIEPWGEIFRIVPVGQAEGF